LAKQRFAGACGVRNYVARRLRRLEALLPADHAEEVKIAGVMFTGARLMADLVKETTLEKRMRKLEKMGQLPDLVNLPPLRAPQ